MLIVHSSLYIHCMHRNPFLLYGVHNKLFTWSSWFGSTWKGVLTEIMGAYQEVWTLRHNQTRVSDCHTISYLKLRSIAILLWWIMTKRACAFLIKGIPGWTPIFLEVTSILLTLPALQHVKIFNKTVSTSIVGRTFVNITQQWTTLYTEIFHTCIVTANWVIPVHLWAY